MDPDQRREDEIDHRTTRRYWEKRSTIGTGDPRAVTLARVPGVLARLEVSLYQSWSFRAIDAVTPPCALAVDLGCGPGTWTVRLAERAERVIAVDLAEGFVIATRQRVASAGLAYRVTVAQADLSSYEIPGGASIIMAGAVVQYLDDADVHSLLARVRAALAPGGVFYLRTTVSRSDHPVSRRDTDFEGNYRPIAWYLNALAAAGLMVGRHATAMRFVPAELNRRWLVGWLVAPFWYLVRSAKHRCLRIRQHGR